MRAARFDRQVLLAADGMDVSLEGWMGGLSACSPSHSDRRRSAHGGRWRAQGGEGDSSHPPAHWSSPKRPGGWFRADCKKRGRIAARRRAALSPHRPLRNFSAAPGGAALVNDG